MMLLINLLLITVKSILAFPLLTPDLPGYTKIHVVCCKCMFKLDTL